MAERENGIVARLNVQMTEQAQADADAIKREYGFTSDSQVVRYALRLLAQRIDTNAAQPVGR